jgi:hypothetical protein
MASKFHPDRFPEAFVITAGETKDLDIDFHACESIMVEGQRSVPAEACFVLHAGELSLTSTSINGTTVESATNPGSGDGCGCSRAKCRLRS